MFSQLPYMYNHFNKNISRHFITTGWSSDWKQTVRKGKVPTSSQFVQWNDITLLVVGIDSTSSVHQVSMLISAYNLYIYIW